MHALYAIYEHPCELYPLPYVHIHFQAIDDQWAHKFRAWISVLNSDLIRLSWGISRVAAFAPRRDSSRLSTYSKRHWNFSSPHLPISAFWRALGKIPKNIYIYIHIRGRWCEKTEERRVEKIRGSWMHANACMYGRVMRARVHRRVKIIENVGYYLTPIFNGDFTVVSNFL